MGDYSLRLGAEFRANILLDRPQSISLDAMLVRRGFRDGQLPVAGVLESGFTTMTETDANQLWSESASERLAAARALSEPALTQALARIRAGLPSADWPYGFATSINPLLVTLGVSPGSARSWKGRDPAKEPFDAPTAGRPHPHLTAMRRATPFGDRIRHLARTILQSGDLTEEDAYALFGNVVLDPNRSGSAKNVTIRPELGRWVLRTIRDDLRARYLICLGMNKKRDAGTLLAETIPKFDPNKPHCEYVFRGYERKRFKFREWDVENSTGDAMKIVYWPQHPSQSPFTSSFKTWQAACKEFSDRSGRLIRP